MASLRVQLCPNTVVPFGVSARARRGVAARRKMSPKTMGKTSDA